MKYIIRVTDRFSGALVALCCGDTPARALCMANEYHHFAPWEWVVYDGKRAR